MSLVALIVLVLVVGVAVFFLKPYLGDTPVKIIYVLLALAVVFWILQAAGLIDSGTFQLK